MLFSKSLIKFGDIYVKWWVIEYAKFMNIIVAGLPVHIVEEQIISKREWIIQNQQFEIIKISKPFMNYWIFRFNFPKTHYIDNKSHWSNSKFCQFCCVSVTFGLFKIEWKRKLEFIIW